MAEPDFESTLMILTLPNLSEVCAEECKALGYTPLSVDPLGLRVAGDLHDAMKLNLHLRTANRVLLPLYEFNCHHPDQLYKGTRRVPWERWLDPDGYFSVHGYVKHVTIRNTQFAGMRVKDAVVDRMREKTNRRPDAGPDRSKAVIYYHWKEKYCKLYLDTSGEALGKHGYRLHPGKAPLSESLAAALLLSTRWDRQQPLANPMCGSGTLAIEAALMALNKPPGLIRTNYAFMHLQPFDASAWSKLHSEAQAQVGKHDMPRILASDIRRQALREARENARKAGVERYIEWEAGDFRKQELPPEGGVLICNPEYGERLGQEKDLEALYSDMGDYLKQEATGYWAYIFTGNLDLAKRIGLRPKRKMPFINARIDCRLLEYELYAGTRRVFDHQEEK